MGKVLLYAKISGDLKTKIISGEYGEGQRLPTEQELQAVYHVSRITVPVSYTHLDVYKRQSSSTAF